VSKKTRANETYVLDTSALLALRGNESGADRVETLLVQAKRKKCRLLVSFMTRMEILYCVRREEGNDSAQEALRLIDSFEMEWAGCDAAILQKAAEIKSAGGLSVADAWIAATAGVLGGILVHKDPEFTRVTDVAQEVLT
jgi:predicted nucleic acid-binding protein